MIKPTTKKSKKKLLIINAAVIIGAVCAAWVCVTYPRELSYECQRVMVRFNKQVKADPIYTEISGDVAQCQQQYGRAIWDEKYRT